MSDAVEVKRLQLVTLDEAGQVVGLGYEIPRAELKMLLKTGRLKVIPFSR